MVRALSRAILPVCSSSTLKVDEQGRAVPKGSEDSINHPYNKGSDRQKVQWLEFARIVCGAGHKSIT